jgi:hypothetical protein
MTQPIPNNETPFLLRFVRPIDPEIYARAVSTSDALGDTYDPETQTSAESLYMAGTSRTIERTMTDWSIRRDDSRTVDD